MADKKTAKKTTKNKTDAAATMYNITKSNGNVIQRANLTDGLIKGYKAKGWKVEGV